MVVADPGPATELSQDAPVTVEGVVRPLFVPDLARDYAWFGLDRELALQLEGRPVIVAESVHDAAGRELVAADRDQTSPVKPTARP